MPATPTFSPGFVYGPKAVELLSYANENDFAIPLLTVNTTSAINAALEAAAAAGSPIALQFDLGGAAFFAGAGLTDADHHASTVGAVAAALYVHTMAKAYGVPVLLGTDEVNAENQSWLEGLLQAGADFYHHRGFPLFTWHRVDMSDLPFEENLKATKNFLRQTSSMHMHLVVSLGTAAQLDGRAHEPVDEVDDLPSPVVFARGFEELHSVSPDFVFSPVPRKLSPEHRRQILTLLPTIIKNAQEYIRVKFNLADALPMLFTSFIRRDTQPEDIRSAIQHGAVVLNVDQVLHDALWEGVGTFVSEHADKTGDVNDIDNHYSNPVQWMRAGEKALIARLASIFEVAGAVGRL